ncbi:MAG TPA: glycosyltransferase [Longimicrobiaceae bacterium]|nr:glycosyltransferase [Longimicrobiaceae bacterium]
MKVLHLGKFYPPDPGGMESHVADLCAALRAHVEVEVVVSGRGRRTVAERVDGVPVTRVGTLASVASASFSPGMVGAIRRARADLVHFHHPNPPAMLAYLASGHRGPLVVTYHSDIVRQRVLGALVEPVLHAFLRRARVIIASSPEYLATSPVLRKHASRCRVIPFGIDAAALRAGSAEEAAALRARYGPRVVLGVGRLVYYKGFDYLIRALSSVGGHLLLAGDGPLRPALEREAAAAGVADRVTFLGSVPDLRPYYHAADVFVLPSVARSEAFGLVQLEAMACGVPVVNTRLGTGVEFVAPHGVAGLTVPPADAAALAGAIGRLLDDPALRAAYGRAGRERVEREFGRERMVRRTLDVYREVAGP